MDRTDILEAIRRLATENGGKAPGSAVIQSQTGIRKSDWYPHLWLRWSDALKEAGYAPNEFQTATSNEILLQSIITLTRELQHIPVEGELRRRARDNKEFPSHTTFARFGGKAKLLDAVYSYCQARAGYEDILALLGDRGATTTQTLNRKEKLATGFVYLMKSGRHHKIGRTISVGSRERQLAVKIPIPPTTIHAIETDDPSGVEAYWHHRFAEKRGEGEWFNLSSDDIKAFKRWKRIV
jgi:Meiotically up-regulated gene 113